MKSTTSHMALAPLGNEDTAFRMRDLALGTQTLNRRSVLGLTLGWASIGLSHAQAPLQTISVVVPQPAGNPTDAIARKLLPMLQKELGQTIVVENLPGAGGSLGINKMLASAASNRTMLLIASQTEPILTPLALAGVRYKAEDLRPVALVSRGPYVLVGRSDLPATTLAEMTTLARQVDAKSLSLGHVGAGSMIHLMGEQWSRRVNAPITLIPYRGLPPIVQDLMGGQIDLSFLPLAASTVTLIESGKLRVFGTTTAEQVPRLPKVRPLSQLDTALGNFSFGTWAAVFVARSTPDVEVLRLHRALANSMADRDFQAYIVAGGTQPAEPMGLAHLEAFYLAETRLYQTMAHEIGIRPQ